MNLTRMLWSGPASTRRRKARSPPSSGRIGTSSHGSCNTRFIKGYKPSNHIRARIKSHVYTIEWRIYHSTYHVKRYNKESTNVIYYINDKMSDKNMRKRRTSTKLSLKLGATGTSTGRWPPRSPRTPGSSGWTPPHRRELSSSRVSPKEQEEKSRVGKSEYTTCTQQV